MSKASGMTKVNANPKNGVRCEQFSDLSCRAMKIFARYALPLSGCALSVVPGREDRRRSVHAEARRQGTVLGWVIERKRAIKVCSAFRDGSCCR
jgi:hypothetical protein